MKFLVIRKMVHMNGKKGKTKKSTSYQIDFEVFAGIVPSNNRTYEYKIEMGLPSCS